MLGARTKHIVSYGRRGHRIIAVSDDRRDKDLPTSASGVSRVVDKQDSTRLKPSYDDFPASSRESTPPSSPEFKATKVRKATKDEPTKPKTYGKALVKRKPLSAVSANVPSVASAGPRSPVVAKAGHKKPKARVVSGKGTPLRAPVSLKPISPVVDVEIIVLDDEGKRINVEKRTTKPATLAVQAKQTIQRPKRPTGTKRTSVANAIVLSDDEDDAPPVVRASRPKKPRKRVVESSSDEDDVEVISSSWKASSRSCSPDSPPPRPRSPAKRRNNVVLSPPISPSSVASTSRSGSIAQPLPSRARVSNASRASLESRPAKSQTTSQPAVNEHKTNRKSVAQPSRPVVELAPPARSKPRPLTPIRSRAAFPAPSSLPSSASDSDLEDSLAFDLEELALSPQTLRDIKAARMDWGAPKQPAHLQPLLKECSQEMPHEFSAFIEMFPFDQIVQTSHDGVDIQAVAHDGHRLRPAFRKIGEASYSEVFGIGDVVLKIIPLRNEDAARIGKLGAADDSEDPCPSDAKDVLKEIIVTRAMGNMCSGFTELLRSYVVRGRYPSLLLDLWDEFHERKGSESVRPDGFTVSQVYAIIVLPNGGPDLESYTFGTAAKVGWRQACSLFWQVARALSQAEELVDFEHRDLHWGQILVKNIAPSESSHRSKKKLSMDSEVHGIQATIIDLGLSRMNSSDDVHWTPFDDETFEGEGDYQFDIYRMMKAHIEGSWKEFRPLTNVMWLHYLLDKLLHSKRLRKPIAPKKAVKESFPPTFSELECWECLTEVEGVLRGAIDDVKRTTKKGRRKTLAVVKSAAKVPSCAGDVVELAYERGWLAE